MDIQSILIESFNQIVTGNKTLLAVAFGITLISGGLWCFFSHRFFRVIAIVTSVLLGLVAGMIAGQLIGESLPGADEAVSSFAIGLPHIIGAVSGALLGGILAIPLFYFLVFSFGAGIGAGAVLIGLSLLRIITEEPLMMMLLGGFVVGSLFVWLSTRARGIFTTLFGALELALSSMLFWILMDGFGVGADVQTMFGDLRVVAFIVFLLSLIGGMAVYALTKKKQPKQQIPPLKVPLAVAPHTVQKKDPSV